MPRVVHHLVLAFGLVLFGFVLIKTAWVCDDAYISFRTVHNFVDGIGLRWNLAERVWTYTNALWVLVMSPIYAITREMYYTSIFVSIGIALSTLVLAIRGLSRSIGVTLLIIAVFCFSKALTDFSTSGLENGLIHLLLIIFAIIFLTGTTGLKRLFWLSLVASLATLSRMDTILLCLPALAVAFWEVRGWPAIRLMALGFLPLILWELFALVYYGFPLPNTFYAKVYTGLPASTMAMQGVYYFLVTARMDPLTIAAIGAAIVGAFFIRERKTTAMTIGIALFLLYVLKVGGDFMVGRFFTAPLVCAIAILTQVKWPTTGWRTFTPAVVAVGIGCFSSQVPILSPSTFGTDVSRVILPPGIVDEREYYYQGTGLLTAKPGVQMPDFPWAKEGKQLTAGESVAIIDRCIGFKAFFAGPRFHFADSYSLVDPLLSHMPCETRRGWRIGHFERTPPEGYDRTLATGVNLIIDSSLHEYYDHLWTVVRGPIFTWNRFVEIGNFLLGKYDGLVEAYVHPPMTRVSYAQVSRPLKQGTPVNSAGVLHISRSGLLIDLEQMSHSPRLSVSVDNGDYYLLTFRRDETEVGTLDITRKVIYTGGLRVDEFEVPDSCRQAGFNAIHIGGHSGDDRYFVGHLILQVD